MEETNSVEQVGGPTSGDGADQRTRPGDDGAAPATTMPLAAVMVDMPGVWRRLLTAHVPDRLGRCRGCRSDTGSGGRWPCSLRRIAEEARRLHYQRLADVIVTD